VKVRYRQRDEGANVRVLADGGLEVEFERPQRAVTPGQSVVLYRDEECLGGAVILSTGAVQDVQEPRRPGSAASRGAGRAA
jgi:tRNA-specific 2-thiouridylase